MTKQQARKMFLAGAGLSAQDIAIVDGTKKVTPMDDLNSITRMLHSARFEETWWWWRVKTATRTKGPRKPKKGCK